MAVIFDLDLTLVDSSTAEPFRKTRDWSQVYKLIPKFSVYAGIPKLIDYIISKQIQIGIVTSAPRTYCEKVISHFQFNIPNTICYHDTKHHKPHPEPLTTIMENLHCNPSQCFYLGDDFNDIVCARAAKVTSVACTWGSKNLKGLINSNPDFVFHTPDEVLNFFQKRFYKS